MKNLKLVLFVALSSLIAFGSTGCRKRPDKPHTVLGSTKKGGPNSDGPVGPETPERVGRLPDDTNVVGQNVTGNPDGTFPQPTGGKSLADFHHDEAIFAAQTVYFDFDKSIVKASERSKAQVVSDRLKGEADKSLLIDGHCDERGTEEYNRSLGERRALALREYVISLGISPNRVYTRSFGEDRPAMEGHTEAAWSKNRRGQFILLTPKP